MNQYDAGDKILRGEIGVLRKVAGNAPAKHKFNIIVEHEQAFYFCSLFFDDAMFGRVIHDIVKKHIGRSITEVGDFDLSFTL
jgi:hypothetical protein